MAKAKRLIAWSGSTTNWNSRKRSRIGCAPPLNDWNRNAHCRNLPNPVCRWSAKAGASPAGFLLTDFAITPSLPDSLPFFCQPLSPRQGDGGCPDYCDIGLSRANLGTFLTRSACVFTQNLHHKVFWIWPVPGRTHETRLCLTHGAGSPPRRHFH